MPEFLFQQNDVPAPVVPGGPTPAPRFAFQLGGNEAARPVLDGAIDVNPEKEAERRRFSSESGTTPSLSHSPDFDRELTLRRIEQAMRDAPATRRFMSNPDMAAVSHDDVDSLSAIERISKGFQRGRLQSEAMWASNQWKARQSPETKEVVDRILARAAALGEDQGGDFVNWLVEASSILGQQYAGLTSPEAAVRIGAGATAGAIVGSGTGPGVLATTAVGAGIGFFAHMMFRSFAENSGETYLNIRELGVEHDIAAPLATAAGTLNAALDMVGVGTFTAPFAKAGRAMLKQGIHDAIRSPRVVAAAKEFARGYGAHLVAETSTEVMQELIGIAAESMGQFIQDGDITITQEELTERIAEIAETTFKATAILGLPGPGLHAVTEYRKAKKADRDIQTVQQVLDAQQLSKLLKRDPAAAAQHFQEVLDGEGDVTTVYVQAQALRDWLNTFDDPDDMISAMGIELDLMEGESFGTDVRMAPEVFNRYVMNSPNWDMISQHFKFDEEGLTGAEAEEVASSGLNDLIDRVREENEPVETVVVPSPLPDAASQGVKVLTFPGAEPDLNGDLPGIIFVEDEGVFQVNMTWLPPSMRDKKLGIRLYEALIDLASRKGSAIYSDNSVSPQAQNVYMALRKRGYTIDLNPRAIIDEESGSLFSPDGSEPVYIIHPPAPDLDPLLVVGEEIGFRAWAETAQELGMKPAQFSRYVRDVAEAEQESIRLFQEQQLKAEQAEVTAELRQKRGAIQEQAREQLSSSQTYSSQFGIQQDRLDREATEAVLKEMGLELRDLPKISGRQVYERKSSKAPTIDPEVYASLYDYASAEEMFQDWLTSPSFEEAVARETSRRFHESAGDQIARFDELQAAREALLNTKVAAVLEIELKAIAAKAGLRRVDTRTLKSVAKQRIQGVRVKDLRPDRYLQAYKRLGKQAGKLMKKRDEGSLTAAAELKILQLVNFYMAQEAHNMSKTLETNRQYLKKWAGKFQKLETVAIDYKDAIADLLRGTSFTKGEPRKLKALSAKRNSDVNPVRPVVDNPVKHWKTMTVSEFLDLKAEVRELHHRGVRAEKLHKGHADRNVTIAVSFIRDNVKRNLSPGHKGLNSQRSFWSKVKDFAAEVRTLILHPDTILTHIDGKDRGGVAYEYLKRPYDDAMTQGYTSGQKGFLVRSNEAHKFISSLYDRFFNKKDQLNFRKAAIRGDGVGKISQEEVLTTLLNLGNEGNKAALLDTTWTEEQIEAIKRAATKRDWEFVQAVWDYFDTFWVEIVEAEVRRRNVRPKRVERTPVQTPFGEFKGGYYPIRYDTTDGTFISESLETTFDELKYGRPVSNHTRRGHVESRKNPGNHRVLLNLNVIQNHVHQVLYDLEMGDAVSDIYKVLHNKDLKKEMFDQGYSHYWEALDAWWRDTVTGELGATSRLEAILRAGRLNFTIAKLGWNMGVTMLQALGLLQSSALLGKRNVFKGMMQVLRHPKDSLAAAKELSPFMNSRELTFHKDMMDMHEKIRKTWVDRVTPGKTAPWLRHSLFYTIRKVQRFVDLITWTAAMREASAQGMEPKDAVHFADRSVARSQASGIFGDRSGIERGTVTSEKRQMEALKLWTVFSSYFIAKYNVTIQRTRKTNWKSPASILNWMTDMALLYVVEAILAEYVRGQMVDTDDDEVPFKLLGAIASTAVAGLPGVREVTGSIEGFPTGGSVGGIATTLGEALVQASQGEWDEAFRRSWAEVAGIFLRAPVPAARKVFEAAAQGEKAEALDFVYGPRD